MILTIIIAFISLIGLVTLHEFGHFILAKESLRQIVSVDTQSALETKQRFFPAAAISRRARISLQENSKIFLGLGCEVSTSPTASDF